MTFLQEVECDTGDKSVILTSSEWASGCTSYSYKFTDGLIGPGMYGPRSKSATGSARLEVLLAAEVYENIEVILHYRIPGRLEFDRFNAVLVL